MTVGAIQRYIGISLLGEVLEAAFPYLERAAGAMHSRLLSTVLCRTVVHWKE